MALPLLKVDDADDADDGQVDIWKAPLPLGTVELKRLHRNKTLGPNFAIIGTADSGGGGSAGVSRLKAHSGEVKNLQPGLILVPPRPMDEVLKVF